MGSGFGRLKLAVERVIDIFLIAVCALFVGVFTYGLVSYPDGPIQPCGIAQFCGRAGEPHTQREFRSFTNWENLLIYSFASAFVAGAALAKRRKRRASQDLGHLVSNQRELPTAFEEQRYAAAWRDRRKRKTVALLLFVVALPAVFWDFGSPEGHPSAVPLRMAIVSLCIVSIFWFHLF